MSTSTPHPLHNLYRLEIEEALEELQHLQKDGFYNVPKITWWILKFDELYEYSYIHRHVGSCIDGMGCNCCWDAPESRFSDLYTVLQEVVQLYSYNNYYRNELDVLEQVRDDHPALMQWLRKNEKLGSEDFLLFWIEWLEEENTVKPFVLGWKDLDIKFRSEEWKNTIKFLEEFNDLYWDSEVCMASDAS